VPRKKKQEYRINLIVDVMSAYLNCSVVASSDKEARQLAYAKLADEIQEVVNMRVSELDYETTVELQTLPNEDSQEWERRNWEEWNPE
jgi:uncharacterized protein YaaN involved in tellurite resistance